MTIVLIKSASPSDRVQDVLSDCLSPEYKGFFLWTILLYVLLVSEFVRKRSFCCFGVSFSYMAPFKH